MEYLYFTGQILLAILLGGILGWQREHIGKPAGMRTYILVTAGSTLFTMLSSQAFALDPARVAAGILTGIGFLGAGIIIHRGGGMVEGLTTAAGLWATAAIGMAVALGWYWQAVIVTVLFLIILMINDDQLAFKKREGVDKK